MAKRLLIPPAILPVTLYEAKGHERIDLVDEYNDDLITHQLWAATSMAENFTRRAFITQTWEFQTSGICPVIEIPRPFLQSIIPNSVDPTSMVFTDWQDVSYPIPDDTWFEDNLTQPGRLIFKQNMPPFPYFFGAGWSWLGPVCGFITLKFVAGYGDTADTVPWEIKEGILQIFGHLYENREGQPIYPGSFAYELLRPFQVDYI